MKTLQHIEKPFILFPSYCFRILQICKANNKVSWQLIYSLQIIFISLDLVLKIIPGGEAEHCPSIKHIDEKRVAVPNSVPGPEDTVVDTAK